MKRTGNSLAALDRGLDVIELLAGKDDVELSELTDALNVSRATVFRTIGVLVERGFVEHIPRTRTYRLGPKVTGLGARASASSLVRVAEPLMLELQAATSETVNLAVMRGGRIVYSAIIEGAYAMRMAATVGQEVPPHATALGKAILARLPSAHAQLLLGREPYEAHTSKTKQRWLDIEPELEAIRLRGSAEDHAEEEDYVTCVAAAITEPDGFPVAAISVSALSARLSRASRVRVAALVRDAAAAISETLAANAPAEASGAMPVAASDATRHPKVRTTQKRAPRAPSPIDADSESVKNATGQRRPTR